MRPTLVVGSAGFLFRWLELTTPDDLFAIDTGVHSVYVNHHDRF